MRLKDDWLKVLQKTWLLLLFITVVLIFCRMMPTSFATLQNLRNIAGNQAVLAIVSLAVLIPLVGGHLDLSLGSILGLSNIITATALSRFSLPLWQALILSVGSGAIVGLLNGLCVAKVRVNSLICTLGVASVLTGLISWYTQGLSIISGIPDSLLALGSGTWLALPRALYYLIATAAFVWYLLEQTPYGRYLHAIGINTHAARLVGLNVDRLVIQSFVISGSLAGFGGFLLVARTGSGNPQVGNYYMFPAMSAAFLGATTIKPGRFNVPGTLLAIFFLATTVSGLSLSGVDNWVESTFNGGSLIAAILVSGLIEKRKAVV